MVDPQNEPLHCINCGCEWLELKQVKKYRKFHNVILGQAPTQLTGISFYLFKCLKCNTIMEPNVLTGSFDKVRKEYNEFLDGLEGPNVKDTGVSSGGEAL